ncbi:hypothetical protein BDY19DRAFT_967371 [Irpex rosettiformis]|uniref:Uncharacterized protein n=1 Tax=Irpex rosettiformis TaxID=378272 RepID=A0ACB8TSV1_9APHY|nr:hypothetical protein BDY19DRAFT_967371 [Irpex rosettiformis]
MSRRSQRIKKLYTDASLSFAVPKRDVGVVDATARGRGGRAQAAKAPDPQTRTRSRRTTTSTVDNVPAETETVVHVPRRRGKLHQMLDMPLDVIMEICLHLQTKDMLNLSRLSKAFRALFTSRTTQYIWKTARINVAGLPPCPEDLTELAYANLLFDPHCHNCQSKNCYFVYWGCRVRLCKTCSNDLSVFSSKYNSIEYRVDGDDDTTSRTIHHSIPVNELVPPLEQRSSGRRFLSMIDVKMCAKEDKTPLSPSSRMPAGS